MKVQSKPIFTVMPYTYLIQLYYILVTYPTYDFLLSYELVFKPFDIGSPAQTRTLLLHRLFSFPVL